MKYKYKLTNKKLTENEDSDSGGGEESGLKKFEIEQEYTLTVPGNAEEVKKILTTYNPETFKGSHVSKSKELKDFYDQVFGRSTGNPKFDNINSKIYQENGKNLYSKIENTIGKPFDKKGAILKKEAGVTMFVFPKQNAYNQALVDEYFTKETNKTTIKSKISPAMLNIVDSDTIKFPLPYGKEIKKILDNAGVEYDLNRTDKL